MEKSLKKPIEQLVSKLEKSWEQLLNLLLNLKSGLIPPVTASRLDRLERNLIHRSFKTLDATVPVLTIRNVQYGGLDVSGAKHVSDDKARQLTRYAVQEGDILFARMGTVGRCCIVPRESDGWLINYHIIRVALNRSRVEPKFIHWTIRCSENVKAYLEEKIRGATREGVNSKIVSSLPCRVPSLSKQRRIVAYLDDLQAKVGGLKQLQTESTAQLDAPPPLYSRQSL